MSEDDEIKQRALRYIADAPRYFDKEGRAMSMMEWSARFGDDDYRRVGADEVGPYYVSTVWLGIDHGFGRTALPLIFETMVFGPGGASDELEQERVATLEEARAVHAKHVAKYTKLAADGGSNTHTRE